MTAVDPATIGGIKKVGIDPGSIGGIKRVQADAIGGIKPANQPQIGQSDEAPHQSPGFFATGPTDVVSDYNRPWASGKGGVTDAFRSAFGTIIGHGYKLGVYDFDQGHGGAETDVHRQGRAVDVNTVNGVNVGLNQTSMAFITDAIASNPNIVVGLGEPLYSYFHNAGLFGDRIFHDEGTGPHIHVQLNTSAAAPAVPKPIDVTKATVRARTTANENAHRVMAKGPVKPAPAPSPINVPVASALGALPGGGLAAAAIDPTRAEPALAGVAPAITRAAQDVTAGGFFGAISGVNVAQAEWARHLAKTNPQSAANFLAFINVKPEQLGLTLPEADNTNDPTVRFKTWIDGVTSIPRDKFWNAALFLGNTADAAWWEPINAHMRDDALSQVTDKPTHQYMADYLSRLKQAVVDPANAGRVLDDLNRDYGFMRNADLNWWAADPQLADALAKAHPTTPQGVVAQKAIELHRAVAAGYLRAPYTTGGTTFVGEFFNPVLALATPERVAGLLGGAARGAANSIARLKVAQQAYRGLRAMGKTIHPSIRVGIRKGVKAASTFVREQMPLTAEPYSATMGDFRGWEGVGRMQGLEENLGNSRFDARTVTNIPEIYAHTSVPVRQTIFREQDRFFNDRTSLYTPSVGGTHPVFDPITRKLSMKQGVIPDLEKADDYAYANFSPSKPSPGTLPVESNAQNAFESAVLNAPGGPGHAVEKLLDEGKYDEAFQAAGMGDQYADFASEAAKMPTPGNLMRRLAGERIASELARRQGWSRVWMVNQRTMHFLDPEDQPEFLTPNRAKIGENSVFSRATMATRLIRTADEPIAQMAPELAKKFIDGHHSRIGIWGNEFDERGQRVSGGGSTHGALPGQGAALGYDSVAEGEAAGLKMDKNFDPADPLERQLARNNRFLVLSKFLREQHGWTKLGGEIDYDALYRQTAKDFAPDIASDPSLEPPEDGFGKGQEGYVAFRKWLSSVAESRVLKASAGSVLRDADKARNVEHEFGRVWGDLRKHYSSNHPGVAFDAGQRLDLESVNGYAIPEPIMASVVQADPVFLKMFTGKAPLQDTFAMDVPDDHEAAHFGGSIAQSISSIMRLGMLLDPTYHPLVNLTTQMVTKSGRVDDAIIAFVAPHTIPEEDYARMIKYRGSEGRPVSSPGASAQKSGEFAYARGPVERGKNPYKEFWSLGERAKAYAKAMNDAGIPVWRWPQAALHFLDDEQQAMVFGLWEDAFDTMLFKRLEKKYGDPHRAAMEMKKTLTGRGAMTALEKKLGLNRIEWFAGWTQRMAQFWLNQLYRSPRNIYAPMEAVRAQNENVAPDYTEAQGPGLGGPRENRIVIRPSALGFRWGDQVYLSPPISTPNFIWGGPVASAITDPMGTGNKWVTDAGMYRLSGVLRLIVQNAVLPALQGPGERPQLGAGWDAQDPSRSHQIQQAFSNVAGAFMPLQGPLFGPLAALSGHGGMQEVYPRSVSTAAYEADKTVRAAIGKYDFPLEQKEQMFDAVQQYEQNPTLDNMSKLKMYADAVRQLESGNKPPQ